MRDPADYTLRWPPTIVDDEIQRLLAIAEDEGVTNDWCDEVTLLLRQAFASTVPADDFERSKAHLAPGLIYDVDEEPF